MPVAEIKKLPYLRWFSASQYNALSYELEYHNALDRFIWDFGCIAGWNIEIMYADNMLSYTCVTERPESEEYLNKVLEKIKNHYKVIITCNTERFEGLGLSGEIIIDFEEC